MMDRATHVGTVAALAMASVLALHCSTESASSRVANEAGPSLQPPSEAGVVESGGDPSGPPPSRAGLGGAAGDACSDASPCASTLTCSGGICQITIGGETGKPCSKNSDCTTGICLPVGDGRNVCTTPCSSGADCGAGWSCSALIGQSTNICQCTAKPETCNAVDDDCDGIIDNEPAVTQHCATTGPFVCKAGACACTLLTCGDACVDPKVDPAHCGGCGNTCALGCQEGACITVAAIAAGGEHTCALLTDRTVRCWGRNDYGQLGDGSFTDRAKPTKVEFLADVVGIAAGEFGTCARMSDGSASCWGASGSYQLGGFFGPWTTPHPIDGLVAGVVGIAIANSHACAVLADGRVQCWGANQAGQLGNGTYVGTSVPTLVPGLVNVAQLAVAQDRTCARLADGTVSCWGKGCNTPVPALVPDLANVAEIAMTRDYSCARLTSGTVRCWGDVYDYGATSEPRCTRTPAPFPELSDIAEIATGQWFGTCVRRTSGAVDCVTDLNGTEVSFSGISSATQLAMGSGHACARLADGSVHCAGSNRRGQLGNGGGLICRSGPNAGKSCAVALDCPAHPGGPFEGGPVCVPDRPTAVPVVW